MRTLHVPASSTFKELHNAVLAAFDWSCKTEHAWSFSVVLRDPITAELLSEVPRTLLTIESVLNDRETETGTWYERGELAKMSDIFEAFRYRERPLVYMPEDKGAAFCINVLGKMAIDDGAGISYIGGQGLTLYEDWHPLHGGRSSWDLNHVVVRERVARVRGKQEAV